jgi:hypothetical protein
MQNDSRTLQDSCGDWQDTPTRVFRFVEEALELAQALDCTKDEAHQLVEYVFNRPVGEPCQEVGGTMFTLMALCWRVGIDAEAETWRELRRCWQPEVMAKIRAKQASKVNRAVPGTDGTLVPRRGATYLCRNQYGLKPQRKGVLISSHPHDGALLIFNEVDREDDNIMALFSCERAQIIEEVAS